MNQYNDQEWTINFSQDRLKILKVDQWDASATQKCHAKTGEVNTTWVERVQISTHFCLKREGNGNVRGNFRQPTGFMSTEKYEIIGINVL